MLNPGPIIAFKKKTLKKFDLGKNEEAVFELHLDDVDVDDDDVCVLHLNEEELLHLLQLRSLLPRPLPLLVSNLQHLDFN